MLKLHLKHALVGSRLAQLAEQARWVAGAPRRIRHPELWDLYLEGRRIRLALARLIQPDHNCIDVGAHVGSILSEIRRLAPEGRHVAFEPSPRKAAWLRQKFPDVELIEAAVSDEPGRATFFDDLDQPGFGGLRRPLGDSRIETYEVDVVTLDEQLGPERRVDFIKIDVEGAELPALRGAHRLLTDQRPTVLFECGPDSQLQRFGYRRIELFGYLVEQGYELYSMVDYCYGRAPMTCEEFDKAGTYPFPGFNFLALSPESEVTRLL